jgi:hypothetical protein
MRLSVVSLSSKGAHGILEGTAGPQRDRTKRVHHGGRALARDRTRDV